MCPVNKSVTNFIWFPAAVTWSEQYKNRGTDGKIIQNKFSRYCHFHNSSHSSSTSLFLAQSILLKPRQDLRANLKLAPCPCRGSLWLQGGKPTMMPAPDISLWLSISTDTINNARLWPTNAWRHCLPPSRHPPAAPPSCCALSVWWRVRLSGQITTCPFVYGTSQLRTCSALCRFHARLVPHHLKYTA